MIRPRSYHDNIKMFKSYLILYSKHMNLEAKIGNKKET